MRSRRLARCWWLLPAMLVASTSYAQEHFTEVLDALPRQTRLQMVRDRRVVMRALAELAAAPEELTWLVDKTHGLPADYAPTDLVRLVDYSPPLLLDDPDHRLRRVIIDDLLEMERAARTDGIELVISSTYRSYADQDRIYRYWLETLGKEEADRTSARPGTSQHQLGTTIDFGCICAEFADEPAGRWLARNAWRYGFSMSYPNGYEDVTGYAYEPWHFRYIGRAAAWLEQTYFAGIQQHLLEFLSALTES